MNRLAREIIANLVEEPHRWSSHRNCWVRDDGHSFWSAHGAGFLEQIKPQRADLGGYFTKRAVWRAFKAWEANMPLGGYQRLEVDAFDHDPDTVARLSETIASLDDLGPDDFVNLSALSREEQRKAMFGGDYD